MAWYNRIWARGLQSKTAVSNPINAVSSPMFGLLQMSASQITPYQAWLLYTNTASLAKIVDLIADGVAALSPVIQVDGKPIDGHPVYNFLTRPGFNRTRKRFIKELTVQMMVTGTGYVHILGNTMAPPAALDVLKSQFVTHFPGPDNWPSMFAYSEATRNVRFHKDDNPRDPRYLDDMQLGEIVPIYDMDGQWRGIGLPRLQAIRNDVELRLKGIAHNSSLLDNGARVGGVLSFKEGMTPEQQEEVAAQFRSMASGAMNAGKVMVTSGGSMDFQSLMQNAKDMDFAKLIEIVEDAMASRYNVPVTLFRTSAQTNNNYETAWNILYDQAVLPTFDMVYSSLAHIFSERLGEQIEIVHDALTNPILKRQAVATATGLFNAKLVSRNEGRQMIGYEPVLGGDTIYGPMAEVPVADDLFNGLDEAQGRQEFDQRRADAIGQLRGKPANDTEADPKTPDKKPDPAASKKAFDTLHSWADSVRALNRQVVH
jgi:HK97 family phage portal protein